MSIRSLSAPGLRSAIIASALAAPLLPGCGADVSSSAHAVSGPVCTPARNKVILAEDFNAPLSGWRAFTSQPTDPDHNFAPNALGQLVSDPAGSTRQNYHNRIDSPYFSLVGETHVRVRLDSMHGLSGDDIYQIYIYSAKDDMRHLIGDFRGKSRNAPGFDHLDIPVPRVFWGKSMVNLNFVVGTGATAPGVGAVIDNLRVISGAAPGEHIAFFDNFESGFGKWRVFSEPGPGDPGHVWDIDGTALPCLDSRYARSDLFGSTTLNNVTRMESINIDLTGKTRARIQTQAVFRLTGDDRLQVYVSEDSGDNRSLIADVTGENPSFPGADSFEIDIPDLYLGQPDVRISFARINGPYGPAFGAAIDNVAVVTD